MPLLKLDRPLHVRRERVFVDSQQRDRDLSRDEFDIVFRLPRRLQNVQAVEVVDYNVPSDIAPTFFADAPGLPGNNMLDVEMERVSTGDTLAFTVELDTEVFYATYGDMVEGVRAQIEAAMDVQGDAFFATGNDLLVKAEANVAEVLDGAEQGLTNFYLQHDVAAPATPEEARLRFLFGTGPNRGRSPARVLGFDEGADTVVVGPATVFFGTAVQSETRGYKIAALRPSRYVDVFLKEAQPGLRQGAPLARLPLADASFLRVPRRVDRPRLLLDPIRALDRLSLRLRLEGGRPPAPATGHDGWDLVLDLLVLADRPAVPEWAGRHVLPLD
jgi:hypothetical protein